METGIEVYSRYRQVSVTVEFVVRGENLLALLCVGDRIGRSIKFTISLCAALATELRDYPTGQP